MQIVLENQFIFESSNLYVDPRKLELDEFSLDFNGAFDLPFKGDVFNGYLHCKDSDVLCVFLSPAGRTNVKNRGEVVFIFTGFIGAMNANMLYIEDPMYKKHHNLDCAWFYGDENSSHIDQVVEIVETIAKKNKIKTENIVFVGASAGGYAAISCADKFKGTKAYAFNPQIKLSDWGYSKKFTELTGLDTVEQDALGRNDISRFIHNKQSKFFLHFNSFSEADKPQVKIVSDALGIEVKDGLNAKDNVFVALKCMDVNLPHNARFDAADLSVAICMMDGYENNMHEIFKAYLNKMYTVARLQDQRFISNKFFDFLVAEKPIALGKPKKLDANFLDYAIDDGHNVFFYRLLYNLYMERFQFIFYVNENTYTFSDDYVSAISKQAAENDEEFLLVRDRKFMRICATPQPEEDIHQAFVAFFERTYAFAKVQLESAVAEQKHNVVA